MLHYQATQQSLQIELQTISYKKPLGMYKPKFNSIPQDYYPLTYSQIIAYSIIVISTIGIVLSMMIGFLFWITKAGLESFVQVWSIIFILFVVVMIIGFYVGGSKRMKQQKKLIAESHKMYNQLSNKKDKYLQ